MRDRDYDFVELFNKIDSCFVEEAGSEWKAVSAPGHFRWERKAACAVILAGVLSIFTFQPQVHAAMVNLANRIASIWNVKQELTPYTEMVNTAQVKDGFTLALSEVILSNDRIYAAVSIESDYEDIFVEGTDFLTINGTDYKVQEVFDQTGNDVGLDEFGRNHIFTFVLDADQIPADITDMSVHFRAYKSTGDVLDSSKAVTFDFTFAGSNTQLQENCIEIPLNLTISLADQGTMQLKRFTLTSVDSVIEAEVHMTGDERYYPQEMTGVDSEGNYIYYRCDDLTESDQVSFISELQNQSLPSMDSEWVELQTFASMVVDEAEHQPADSDGEEEYYMEEDGKPVNQVPLGDKIRISLK